MSDQAKNSETTAAQLHDLEREERGPVELTAADAEAAKGGLFEVEDYSFDIEQTLNIGSQSTGAGAGKVTFNPFQAGSTKKP